MYGPIQGMFVGWLFIREKPGYCITSSIKLDKVSGNQGLRFISFPAVPSNSSPSYLDYDESLFSQLPMKVNSSFELTFILHFTDTMFLLHSFLISSELQMDIQYSIDSSSKYTRMTSYSYHYVVEEPLLSMQSSSISVNSSGVLESLPCLLGFLS